MAEGVLRLMSYTAQAKIKCISSRAEMMIAYDLFRYRSPSTPAECLPCFRPYTGLCSLPGLAAPACIVDDPSCVNIFLKHRHCFFAENVAYDRYPFTGERGSPVLQLMSLVEPDGPSILIPRPAHQSPHTGPRDSAKAHGTGFCGCNKIEVQPAAVAEVVPVEGFLSNHEGHDLSMEDGTLRRYNHIDPRGYKAPAVVEDSGSERAACLTLHIMPGERYDEAHTVFDAWENQWRRRQKILHPIGQADAYFRKHVTTLQNIANSMMCALD